MLCCSEWTEMLTSWSQTTWWKEPAQIICRLLVWWGEISPQLPNPERNTAQNAHISIITKKCCNCVNLCSSHNSLVCDGVGALGQCSGDLKARMGVHVHSWQQCWQYSWMHKQNYSPPLSTHDIHNHDMYSKTLGGEGGDGRRTNRKSISRIQARLMPCNKININNKMICHLTAGMFLF